jgi:hypothetical protein
MVPERFHYPLPEAFFLPLFTGVCGRGFLGSLGA